MRNDDVTAIIDDIMARAPRGGKIVFVSGDFNVIHPGHQRILNFAAECGDFLVVGVNAQGRGGFTIVPEDLRCAGVSALTVVNASFILKIPAQEFIARLKPAIVVKGTEHRKGFNIEQRAVDTYGGKLLFCSGEASYSSLDLLRHELQTADFASIHKPTDFPQRHEFGISDLHGLVRKFCSLRVVVVGDLIVDEYIDCDPLGMSREDPTLVITPIMSKRFVGGAGIVAAHARALGAEVSYFGIANDDPTAHFAVDTLSGYGVKCHLEPEENRPTTLKQRFRASNKTLLRVSHLRQHDIGDDLVDSLAEQIDATLARADLLIFSDFNYGCLPQALVDRVIESCRKHNIPFAADSQASSQIADISRFKGALLLTPTEYEARLALGDSRSGLVVLAETLKRKAEAQHIIITLASEGILIHSPDAATGLITDRLPALNSAPKDVSGGGDCLLACAAMALVVCEDIWQSAYLGSIAAACQVSRLGNMPLTAEMLNAELSLGQDGSQMPLANPRQSAA